ncbi:MAG TPA: hypothetical protein VFS75_01410 [Candidatus Paceibacterota bacterium]|nr:hypothetical protein [Candidatus Paceibacterota bacterium]
MNDLSKFGLMVRAVRGCPKGQKRYEVRTANSNAFVALVHLTVRVSDGEPVTTVATRLVERKEVEVGTQFVHRRELTEEQIAAIQEWQRSFVLPALSRA